MPETDSTPVELCPHCDVEAMIVRERRSVPLGQRRVEIEDEFLRCPKCDEDFYTPAQADVRQKRALERARAEDNLLSPAKIRAIREEFGLSQRLFELLLGVGEKTCVRWEQGRVCPNVATDRLIRLLAADRENVQRLAAINGVPLTDLEPAPAQEVEEWYEIDLLRRSSAPGATPFWHRHASYCERDVAERDIREEHAGRSARLVRVTREVVAEFPAQEGR